MAGNPFYVKPASFDIGPMLDGIGSVMKQNREKKAEAEQMDEIAQAVNANDPDAVSDLMVKYPDRAKDIEKIYGMKQGVTKPMVLDAYRKATIDPENGEQYFREAAAKVEATGRKPTKLLEQADFYAQNPQAAQDAARITYAGLDQAGYKALQKERGEGDDKPDWMGARTFAVGAGDGQMQRGVLNADGEMVKLGQPYDPRNPYLDVGTGYVNPNDPKADVQKNIAQAEFRKKEGVANQKFYDDYVPETDTIKGIVAENNITKDMLNEFSGLQKSSTSGFGKWLSGIPMTDAKYVDELKSTIQSRLAMTKMMALKAASSTGSTGFGALSEKELKLLTDYEGSLELAQSPADIKKVIMRIYNSLDSSNRGMEKKLKINESKYNRLKKKYGMPDESVIQQPQSAPQQPAAPQVNPIDDLVNKYAQ